MDIPTEKNFRVVRGGSIGTLRSELEDAIVYARAEKAPATYRAYRSDFDIFKGWCEARSLCPLPALPESVVVFLASEATRHFS